MSNVVTFPHKKSQPNAVMVQFDFGKWTLAYFHDQRFLSRLDFPSKAAAEAEALRLAERGVTWRMGENGTVCIMPDSADGGCWAVAHQTRSASSDAILGRHFDLRDAVSHAVRAASEIGAEFSLNEEFNDEGGAA